MGHLSNADFLSQLQHLFASRQPHGSVFLTQKRLTYEAPPEDAAMSAPEGSSSSTSPDSDPDREWPCLIRATDGKDKKEAKVKISTIVQPLDYPTFSLAYGTLLKNSFSTLRKKRKIKRKPVSTSVAGTAAPGKWLAGGTFIPAMPKVVGPRRGAGKGKRDRSVRRRQRELKKMLGRKKKAAVAAVV